MDGARLFTFSGTNGANGTTYRTETETYSVITSYGSVNGVPQYFHVINKDSTVMGYGYSDDSRVMDDAGVNVMWNLTR